MWDGGAFFPRLFLGGGDQNIVSLPSSKERGGENILGLFSLLESSLPIPRAGPMRHMYVMQCFPYAIELKDQKSNLHLPKNFAPSERKRAKKKKDIQGKVMPLATFCFLLADIPPRSSQHLCSEIRDGR